MIIYIYTYIYIYIFGNRAASAPGNKQLPGTYSSISLVILTTPKSLTFRDFCPFSTHTKYSPPTFFSLCIPPYHFILDSNHVCKYSIWACIYYYTLLFHHCHVHSYTTALLLQCSPIPPNWQPRNCRTKCNHPRTRP